MSEVSRRRRGVRERLRRRVDLDGSHALHRRLDVPLTLTSAPTHAGGHSEPRGPRTSMADVTRFVAALAFGLAAATMSACDGSSSLDSTTASTVRTTNVADGAVREAMVLWTRRPGVQAAGDLVAATDMATLQRLWSAFGMGTKPSEVDMDRNVVVVFTVTTNSACPLYVQGLRITGPDTVEPELTYVDARGQAPPCPPLDSTQTFALAVPLDRFVNLHTFVLPGPPDSGDSETSIEIAPR